MRSRIRRLVAAAVLGFAGTAAAGDPIQPAGGCATCAPASPKGHHGPIGAGCANPVACGTWASERTFLFGSCSQFFNPVGDCNRGPAYHNWFHKNVSYPQGKADLGNCDPCVYGSYLNR